MRGGPCRGEGAPGRGRQEGRGSQGPPAVPLKSQEVWVKRPGFSAFKFCTLRGGMTPGCLHEE